MHQKVQAIDGNASQQAPIEPAESPMDPFDNCNRRAADNTPLLSCTVQLISGIKKVMRLEIR